MINAKLLNKRVYSEFKKATRNGLDTDQIITLINQLKLLPARLAINGLEFLKNLYIRYELANTAIVESAQDLSPSQHRLIQNFLSTKYSKSQTKSISVKLNPSLLAGIRVKIGDDVYEDSLSSRLTQLKGAIIK